MKTTKKIYVIHEEKEIVDYDELGNPVYEKVKTYKPIDCQVEPFSSKLAEESYGVFIDATQRVFSRPNDLIKLDEQVEYNDTAYKVTEIIRFDKHFETMLAEIKAGDSK